MKHTGNRTADYLLSMLDVVKGRGGKEMQADADRFEKLIRENAAGGTVRFSDEENPNAAAPSKKRTSNENK